MFLYVLYKFLYVLYMFLYGLYRCYIGLYRFYIGLKNNKQKRGHPYHGGGIKARRAVLIGYQDEKDESSW